MAIGYQLEYIQPNILDKLQMERKKSAKETKKKSLRQSHYECSGIQCS